MAIKLLLITDVENVGRSGEIVSVREGFARNFIIPRGLGVKADQNALRRQSALQEAREKQAVQDKADSDAQAKALELITLETEVKVDAEGHMYGSVAQQDIVRFLAEQHSIEMEKRCIQLKLPIKKLGAHRIEFKLKEGVEAFCTLKITGEGLDFDAAIEAAKSDVVQDIPEEVTEV